MSESTAVKDLSRDLVWDGSSEDINIDGEFRDYVPAISKEEREQLEANLIEYGGARDPLTVWLERDNHFVLLDGHNRFEICKRLGLPFALHVVEFDTRQEAADWIDRNQLGRRNLSRQDYKLLLGRRYNRAKRADGGHGDQKSGGKTFRPNAAESLAKDHGVTEKTVRNAGKFQAAAAKLGIEKEIAAGKASTSVHKARLAIAVGDCITGMNAMPAGSAALIVADPPYNIGIDYGDGANADRMPHERYAAWTQEWVAAAARVLADNGTMFVICGQEVGAVHDLAIQAAGLTIRNRITWYETFGVNCRAKFNRTSRPIFYAVKNPKVFTFNRDAVTVPSARLTKYGDKRAAKGGKLLDDVWQIPRVCGTHKERVPGFPTQLPLALVRRIVLCASNPGELVVDPFAGSGTTGVVCAAVNREFRGFELRQPFAEAAVARIHSAAATA